MDLFRYTGVIDLISGGSRSTTPTPKVSRKSPTMEQGVQVNQPNAGKIGDKGPGRNAQQHNREK